MVVGMQMPLHTIIEIQMGVTGVQEKRYKLMETQSENLFSFSPSLNNCLQDPPTTLDFIIDC
jgi:hypothetical protein